MHHRLSTLRLWSFIGLASLPLAAGAAKLNVLGSQSGTVNATVDLATVRYDVTGKRVVATTTAGNFGCPQGAAPPSGGVGLTIDGNTYGVVADPAGAQAQPVDYAPGTKEFTLQVSGSELCKSSDTTAAGLKLFFDEQGPFTVAESVFYAPGTRQMDIRVAQPVLCWSYAQAGAGLTLRLTDAGGAAVSLPGFRRINYLVPATAEIHADSQTDAFTSGRAVQCYGVAATATAAEGQAAPSDHIFGSHFEYTDLQADLVVDAVTQQPNVLADGSTRGFQYVVTVRNRGNAAATDVRLGEYVPAVTGATLARGGWSCQRYASDTDVNPVACGTGAAGTVFAPSGLAIAGGERLVFTLDRSVASTAIGTGFTLGVAAFVAPVPGGDARPDADYANNSDAVAFQLVGNQPPQGPAPLAGSTTEDGSPITIVFSPTDPEGDAISAVSVTSSNTTLFPGALALVPGPGANQWSVTLAPAANENGTATITATFGDGTGTGTIQASATVTPVNDAPEFTLSSAALAAPACNPGPTCDFYVDDFISAITAGPANETGQAVEVVRSPSGRITCSSVPAGFFGGASGPLLVQTAPTWRLAAEGLGASGTATCEVTVREVGDPASTTTKSFTITYP